MLYAERAGVQDGAVGRSLDDLKVSEFRNPLRRRSNKDGGLLNQEVK